MRLTKSNTNQMKSAEYEKNYSNCSVTYRAFNC